jgi:restriction endonuclease S subunit
VKILKALIKDIAHIQTGLFAKPTGIGELAYLQSKHFDEQGRLQAVLHPDLMAEGIAEKHLLRAGDVLFSAKGTKNFAAVYENRNPAAVASTSFFVMRLINHNILPEFLAWFLNHPQTQSLLKGQARGTSIPSITKSALEDLELVIPPVEKQILIVRLSQLILHETELRERVITQRKQLVEQQIINAIK